MDGLVRYIGSKAVKITPVMRKDMNAFGQRKEEINELIKTLNNNNALRADKEMKVASLRDALVSEDRRTARDATKQTKILQKEISKIDSENQNIQNKLDKLNDKQAGAQHPGVKIMLFGKPEETIQTYVVNINNNPVPAEAVADNVEPQMPPMQDNNQMIYDANANNMAYGQMEQQPQMQNVNEINMKQPAMVNEIPTVETTQLPGVDVPDMGVEQPSLVNKMGTDTLPSADNVSVPEPAPEVIESQNDLTNEISTDELPNVEVPETTPEVTEDQNALANEISTDELPNVEVPETTPEVTEDQNDLVNEISTDELPNVEVPETTPKVTEGQNDLANEISTDELPNVEVPETTPEVTEDQNDLVNEISTDELPNVEVPETTPEVTEDQNALANEIETEPGTEALETTVDEEKPTEHVDLVGEGELPIGVEQTENETTEEPNIFDENNEFEPINENAKEEPAQDNIENETEKLEKDVHDEIERAVPTFIPGTAIDGAIYMDKIYEENGVVPEQPIVERDLKNLSTFEDYADYKFTFAQKHFDKDALSREELKEIQSVEGLLSEEEFVEKRTKEYSKISNESKRLKEKVIKLGDDFTKKVDEINETYNATVDSLTKVVDDAKKLAEKERVEKIQTQRLNDTLTTSIREKEEEITTLTSKISGFQNLVGTQEDQIAGLEAKNSEQADKIKVLEAKLNTVFGIVQGIKE